MRNFLSQSTNKWCPCTCLGFKDNSELMSEITKLTKSERQCRDRAILRLHDYHNPEIEKYESFLRNNNIEIAGIEYVKDRSGVNYTYDVNTNTNYNAVAEKKAGLDGMLQIAKFLKKELTSQSN